MKIDNFDRIAGMLDFSDKEKFYLLNIIQRKKDIPDLYKSTRLIKTYSVGSIEYLYSHKDEIIGLCDLFGARAGLYVNRRSHKTTARAMMKALADYFVSGNFYGVNHLYTSSASAHGCGDKFWLLDIDLSLCEGTRANPQEDFYDETLRTIEKDLSDSLDRKLTELKPIGDRKLIGLVPTAHGWHAVTRPFDTRKISEIERVVYEFFEHYDLYASIELKKDAMLNIYIP